MSLYQDTDEAQRGAARRKVSRAAHAGDLPSRHFSGADLEWAFEGHEAQLAELEGIAEQKREEEQERDQLAARRRDVAATAEKLIKQWDMDERRERRERAWIEAEKLVAEREAAES